MSWLFNRGNGGFSDVTTTTLAGGTTTTRYDEAGNATADTISIALYEINDTQVGIGGTGNIGDSLTTDTAGDSILNDAVIWDDNTTNQSATIFGTRRFASNWNNQNQAADVFDLAAGNDVLNFTASGAANQYIYDATVFGGHGSDVIWSGAGNDSLYGDEIAGSDGSRDTIFGGAGNDGLYFGRDTVSGGGGPGDYVQLWDGEGGSGFTALYSAGGWSADIFNGGTGSDSLIGTAGIDLVVMNTNDIFVGGVARPDNASRITGIELVLLGAGADILSLTDVTGNGTGTVYSNVLTAYGGDGNDIIVSGSGNDILVGDSTLGATITSGSDIIFGGAGDDVIWGDNNGDVTSATGNGADTLYGGSGADTIYGGGGADSIFGGAGIDALYGGDGDENIDDSSASAVYGGSGNDIISIHPGGGANSAVVFGDGGGVGDGNDRVSVKAGGYAQITADLGGGNDLYIANQTNDGTGLSDIVTAGTGNDAVSSWYGNDTIYGGDGVDVLWGGAGNDLVYGGADTDWIYAQEGSDVIYGGAGWDMIYFGRNDGTDQFYDQNREGIATAQENWIVVYGVFDTTEAGPTADYLLNGAGVREADHSLAEAIGGANMAQITSAGGTLNTLTVTNTSGGISSITFDTRDIVGIALWDNDFTDGHVVQVYTWNGTGYAYAYSI